MLDTELEKLMFEMLFADDKHPHVLFITLAYDKDINHHKLINLLENRFASELKDIEHFSDMKFDIGPLKSCWIERRSKIGSIYTYGINVGGVEGEIESKYFQVSHEFVNGASLLCYSKPKPKSYAQKYPFYNLKEFGIAALNRWGARSQVIKILEEVSELSSVFVTLGFGLESFESQRKLEEKVAREVCDVENVLIQLSILWDIPYNIPSLESPENIEKLSYDTERNLNALRLLNDSTRILMADDCWLKDTHSYPTENVTEAFTGIVSATETIKHMLDSDIVYAERLAKAEKFYKYIKDDLCTQLN